MQIFSFYPPTNKLINPSNGYFFRGSNIYFFLAAKKQLQKLRMVPGIGIVIPPDTSHPYSQSYTYTFQELPKEAHRKLESARFAVYRAYRFLCKYASSVILLAESSHQKRADIRDENRGHLWPGNTWLLATPGEEVISEQDYHDLLGLRVGCHKEKIALKIKGQI